MAGGSADGRANRAAEAALALIAAVNVLAGILLSLNPDRLEDFHVATGWARAWMDGAHVYGPASLVNYPPNAIVLLAPLAALGDAGPRTWVAVNVAAAIGTAMLFARRAPRWTGIASLALPWARTLNQFSIAAFAPAFWAVCRARTAPALAGVAIGLSLAKPQIGGPALLWAVVTRRWTTVAWAAGVPIVLCVIYAIAAGVFPATAITDWAAAAARRHNHPHFLPGDTDLAFWAQWAGWPPATAQLYLSSALWAIAIAVFVRRGDAFRLFAAVCLASLAGFRHFNYDLMLAVPALIWLVRSPAAWAPVVAAAAWVLLVASPPTIWRQVLADSGLPVVELVLMHALRGTILVLFAATLLAPPEAREATI